MRYPTSIALLLACLAAGPNLLAGDVFKANNGTALNQTGSWTGGVVPTATDVAVWDAPYSVSSSLGTILGASMTWQGIRVASPVTVPRIKPTSGAVLTLGSAGIDMSAASNNLDMYAALKAGVNQSWNVASGRTLTLQGDLQGTGVTVTKTGAGTLQLASTSLNYAGALTISGGTVQVNGGAGTQELAGSLGGTGALSKSGVGALTLSGGNSAFSGGITLTAGQLNLNHASALGSGVFALNGGLIDNTKGTPLTLDGAAPLAWNGDFSFVGSSNLDLGTTATSLTGSRSVTVSGGTLAISSSVTGGPSAALTKLGAGVLETKSGSSIDLEGRIAVGGGTLRITAGSVACGSASGNLELTGGGTVELNGGTLTARSVARTGPTANFRFNGGLLKPRADSPTFMTGLDSATVGASGANLGLDGWYVTIAQPLLHDSALGSSPDGGLHLADDFSSGILTLNGASTYTGPTVIETGTLVLGAAGTISSSSVIEVKSGGTLDVLASKSIASGQTLKGTGTVFGNLTVSPGGTLSPGGEVIGTLGIRDTLVLSGDSSFQINKSGSTLTCDKVEGLLQVTYGGTLTVTASGGTLALGDSFKLFDSAAYSGGFTTFNLPVLPAGLYWEPAGLLVDGTIAVINTLPTPALNPSAGAYLGARNVTITGVSGATIRYTTDGSDPWTSPTSVAGPTPVTGILVPDGSVDFTIKTCQSKSGAPNSPVATAVYQILDTGTWTYDGSGTWTDSTKWYLGVVPQGAGITADFSTITLLSSPTVTLDTSRVIGKLKFGDVGGSNNWTLAGSTLTLDNGTSQPVIHVAGNTATITAPLAGTNGYVKTGPGNLVSQLANSSLSGNTVISQGSALVDRTNSLGTGTIILGDASTGAAEAGILQRGSDPWPPASDFGTTNNILVAAGPTGRLVVGRQNSGNYAANYTGTITLNNNVVFRNNGGDRLSIEGKITGTGNVTIEGNRINWNSATNDFIGDVTVAVGGVFQPNAATTIPATSNITVNGSMGTNSATGETITFGALNGTGNIYRLAAGYPTLALGGNGQNGDFQGVIQNDFPVIKAGGGTQIFSGASTYTGGTTVNGGTLLINNTTGSGTGTGAVTVNSAASLGGTGSISGGVTVNAGAALAPGSNGVGTLATGSTTLAGSYQCQVSGAVTDQLSVNGNLDLTGSSLVVSTIGAVTPGTYVIGTHTGTRTGTFASVTSGYTVDYGTPNQVKLVVTGTSDPYQTWVGGFGLSGNNALPDADPDLDGIANSVEFVLGGNPATVQNQNLLPTITLVSNPGGSVPNGDYLRFTYRRTPASAYLNPDMQYDADLTGTWTSATGAPGAVQVVTPNFYASPTAADKVDVYVPRAGNAVNGRLFGRLRVVNP